MTVDGVYNLRTIEKEITGTAEYEKIVCSTCKMPSSLQNRMLHTPFSDNVVICQKHVCVCISIYLNTLIYMFKCIPY